MPGFGRTYGKKKPVANSKATKSKKGSKKKPAVKNALVKKGKY